MRMLSKKIFFINELLLTELNHLLVSIFVFKAAFVLGALEQSFSGALQEVS